MWRGRPRPRDPFLHGADVTRSQLLTSRDSLSSLTSYSERSEESGSCSAAANARLFTIRHGQHANLAFNKIGPLLSGPHHYS